MIITAAHNFKKRTEDGESEVEFVDAVFALHRKSEDEMLAKFKVIEHVSYGKFDANDEEYFLQGTDVALAIVEVDQPISESAYDKIRSTFESPGYISHK